MTTPGHHTNTHHTYTHYTTLCFAAFCMPPTKKSRKTLAQQATRSKEDVSCANRLIQYLYQMLDDQQIIIDPKHHNEDTKAITDLFLNMQRFKSFVERLPAEPMPTQSLPVQTLPTQSLPVQPMPTQQMYYAPTMRQTVPLGNLVEYTPPKLDRYGNRFREEGSVSATTLTNSPGSVFRPLFSEL